MNRRPGSCYFHQRRALTMPPRAKERQRMGHMPLYTSDASTLLPANANSPSWTLIKTIVPTKAGAQACPCHVHASLPAACRPCGRNSAIRAAHPPAHGHTTDHDDLSFAVQ